MAAYIVLANSNASLSKKFGVLQSGYEPRREKIGTHRVTVTGKIDNQVGPVIRQWVYTMRVYASNPPTGYGTLGDLKTLFDLNDPQATPSNVITLTDFDDTNHSVYMMDMLSEKPVTWAIAGDSARLEVTIVLRETTAV